MTKEEYEWHKQRVETDERYPQQLKDWMLKNLDEIYAARNADETQEETPKQPPEEMNGGGA